jgi:hypothetical protein
MCNSNSCQYEISSGPNWGDCKKPSNKKCPEDMTEEEQKEAEDYEDIKGDYLYEQKKDRDLEDKYDYAEDDFQYDVWRERGSKW